MLFSSAPEAKKRLIVGLGNPGLKYTRTRHNLGFEVVRAFAEKEWWRFKKSLRFNAEIAHGTKNGSTIHLLLPMTYMNLSGLAVQKAIRYYGIPFNDPQHFLVVLDDAMLPFGDIRLRPKGSAGGHNGLKSIEEYLGSSEYARLRVGIGHKALIKEPLEDYVLKPFTAEEQKELPKVVEKALAVIECWFIQGLEKAMQMAGELG